MVQTKIGANSNPWVVYMKACAAAYKAERAAQQGATDKAPLVKSRPKSQTRKAKTTAHTNDQDHRIPPRSKASHPKLPGLKRMTITICELEPASNGSHRAVLQQNGQDLEWKASQKTTLAWQPSAWDPSSDTLDYCFKLTAELEAFVSALEAEIATQVTKDSQAYFGKTLAPDVIKATFKTALKVSSKGTQHFKCKGRYSNIKFWDKNSKQTAEPSVWGSGDAYKIAVRASAVWINDRGWGISYDLAHLQSFAADCPF